MAQRIKRIHNQRSYEKIIPELIFSLNNDDLSLFIKHLWATDGTIYFNRSSNTGPSVLLPAVKINNWFAVFTFTLWHYKHNKNA